MGMEQTVAFDAGNVPAWDAVGALLFGLGYSVQLRMIDGQLSLPDEQPPDDWRELRVGTPQGMVTLRRAGERISLVTWGNADRGLTQAWNALTWACAEAGGGRILSEKGPLSPADYRRGVELPF